MEDGKFTAYDLQCAKLAGFFDGEGSVCVYRATRAYGGRQCVNPLYHLSVQVGQHALHAESLYEFKRMFGGTVSLSYKKHNIAQWAAHGDRAVNVIKALFPYLTVKYEIALLGFIFQRYKQYQMKHRRAIGRRQSEAELGINKALWQACRNVNRNKTEQYIELVRQGVAPILAGSAG